MYRRSGESLASGQNLPKLANLGAEGVRAAGLPLGAGQRLSLPEASERGRATPAKDHIAPSRSRL